MSVATCRWSTAAAPSKLVTRAIISHHISKRLDETKQGKLTCYVALKMVKPDVIRVSKSANAKPYPTDRGTELGYLRQRIFGVDAVVLRSVVAYAAPHGIFPRG